MPWKELTYASIVLIILLVAGLIGLLVRRRKGARQIANAREEAESILTKAREDGEKFKREAAIDAREKDLSRQAEFDIRNREKQRKINETERRLVNKEENLERRFQALERKEREQSIKDSGLAQK